MAKTPEELAEAKAKQQLKDEAKAKEDADKVGEAGTATAAESETVTVSRAKLEAMMARIDRLESAASKAGLAHYDSQHKEKMTKEVRVRTLNGKIVVGESMTKNIVEKNQNGVYREEQELELTLQDGSKLTMPYVYYVRTYKHIPCRVLAETKNLDEIDAEMLGDYLYKVSLPSGEVMEIGSKFIN